MALIKPNVKKLKKEWTGALNLENLENKSSGELEQINPDFLFEKAFDYDAQNTPLCGFYVTYKYYCADAGAWRHSCRSGSQNSGFYIDFNGNDYDSLQEYLEYLDLIETV